MRMKLGVLIGVASLSLLGPSRAVGGEMEIEATTTGKPYWTAVEQEVWAAVKAGELADLGAGLKNETADGAPAPVDPAFKRDERRISARFLRDILSDRQFLAQVPATGVLIKGAWIEGPISLADIACSATVWLDDSLIEGRLDGRDATFEKSLSLAGSVLRAGLNLNGVSIGGELLLNRANIEGDLTAMDLEVGGQTQLMRTSVSGTIRFDNARFRDRLEIEESCLAGVVLRCFAERNITISDTVFSGELDMVDAHLERSLLLMDVKIEQSLVAFYLEVRGGVTFSNVQVSDSVQLTSAEISESLTIAGDFFCGSDLDLSSGKIGSVKISFAPSTKPQVGGSIKLTFLTVAGDLSITDVNVQGEISGTGLNTHRLLISRSLANGIVMVNGSFGGRVAVQETTLPNGDLNFYDSKFGASLMLDRITVERGDVELSFSRIGGLVSAARLRCPAGEFRLRFGWVESALTLAGAELHQANLEQSTIGKSLHLWNRAPNQGPTCWTSVAGEPSRLNLRQTSVQAIVDHPEAWPAKLDLLLFEYDFWDVSAGGAPKSIQRDAAWFTGWLDRDTVNGVHPQPSHRLARFLKDTGRSEAARDVIKSHYLRRLAAAPLLEKIWLKLFQIFTGFGQSLGVLLLWVAGLVAVGSVVIGRANAAPHLFKPDRIVYSLDRTIPFVKFDRSFDDVPLTLHGRRWFYFQRFFGYFLGTMLVAAIFELVRVNY